MKLWPYFTLFLLLPQTALLGQGVAGLAKKGDDALADGLWEIAEMHYRDVLGTPAISPEMKAHVALRLAESMVRSGNTKEAMEILGQPLLAKNPETAFWKAMALAGEHRFSESAVILSGLLAEPEPPFRTETGFTLASLQLALNHPDAALDTLSKLIPGSDAETSVKIALHQVEILLDLDRIREARRAMPEPETIAEPDVALADFLEAQLLLREDKPSEAEAAFMMLVSEPQGQTLERNHAAVIGVADAIKAGGNTDGASRYLLAFIQDHPDTPVLEAMFSRLLDWLPEKPAATDAVMERLAGWITPQPLPSIGPIAMIHANAASAWPSYTEASPVTSRQAYSLFIRAVGLHRVGTPEARAEARRLFHRLRVENPGSVLAGRSLYQQARWLLDEGSVDAALSLLDTIRDTSDSHLLKGEAAFLEARLSYQNGDTEKTIQLFDEAAKTLSGPLARSAKLQSAIARLRAPGNGGSKLIQQPSSEGNGPLDHELEADLMLERALSATPPSTAKTALSEFLARFPDHPRAAEARLAAAEAALTGSAPDPVFANAQLDALAITEAEASDRGETEQLPPQRIALARLRATDLSGDHAATIIAAQAIIDTYPADPAAAEAGLTLGRNHFETGSYNSARLVLEKLASTDTDIGRAQAAWLLAARSAALGGTPQSKEQALILFDNAIGKKGPVTALATLEKGRHLIDMYRLADASEFLGKWVKTLPANDPLQLPAGLLLAEALYAQGSGDTESLLKALAIYDKLVLQAKEHPALLNRLQFLRGTTLEKLPDAKDPTHKREREAFQAFHSVLETTTPPAEWEYFEHCGFRALALLEKSKRWEAAIAVAKKIASFKGPRAGEATERAKELQLEHMIWSDG